MNISPPSAVQQRSSWSVFRTWLQDWSELAKARLSLLVLLTTLVGLYCGSAGRMELWRTVFTLLGTSLVAAAAAVLNEWLERDLDAKCSELRTVHFQRVGLVPTRPLWAGQGWQG